MQAGRFAVFAGLFALSTAIPAWAHHSFAASYDLDAPVTVHGVSRKCSCETRTPGSGSK